MCALALLLDRDELVEFGHRHSSTVEHADRRVSQPYQTSDVLGSSRRPHEIHYLLGDCGLAKVGGLPAGHRIGDAVSSALESGASHEHIWWGM